MSIQVIVEEKKASNHNLTRLEWLGKENKSHGTGVDCSGVGRPWYKEVRGGGIAGWVRSGGIQVWGI